MVEPESMYACIWRQGKSKVPFAVARLILVDDITTVSAESVSVGEKALPMEPANSCDKRTYQVLQEGVRSGACRPESIDRWAPKTALMGKARPITSHKHGAWMPQTGSSLVLAIDHLLPRSGVSLPASGVDA